MEPETSLRSIRPAPRAEMQRAIFSTPPSFSLEHAAPGAAERRQLAAFWPAGLQSSGDFRAKAQLASSGGNPNRRDIALSVQKILWDGPDADRSERDLTLDDLAERRQVSRRTVQLAVQENFNMGFTALRRMIRLHQVRRAINEQPHKNVSELAMQFYFNHLGRFSRDYFDTFGVLPSEEIRRTRNRC